MTASSRHPGAVTVAMTDGSVRAIKIRSPSRFGGRSEAAMAAKWCRATLTEPAYPVGSLLLALDLHPHHHEGCRERRPVSDFVSRFGRHLTCLKIEIICKCIGLMLGMAWAAPSGGENSRTVGTS